MATRCLAVTGGRSVAKCGRLGQPSWLLVRTIIQVTWLALLRSEVQVCLLVCGAP